MFYLDDSNIIRGWDFFSDPDRTDLNGTISRYSFSAGSNTRMGSYWPSLIFQDASESVQEIIWNKSLSISDSDGWSQRSIGVQGWSHSGLAEVPLSPNFANYGVNLLYQRDDGKLIDFSRNNSLTGWSIGKYLGLC